MTNMSAPPWESKRTAETRQVEVRTGQTTEVRFHLPAERSRGRGAVSGFFSRLGL